MTPGGAPFTRCYSHPVILHVDTSQQLRLKVHPAGPAALDARNSAIEDFDRSSGERGGAFVILIPVKEIAHRSQGHVLGS